FRSIRAATNPGERTRPACRVPRPRGTHDGAGTFPTLMALPDAPGLTGEGAAQHTRGRACSPGKRARRSEGQKARGAEKVRRSEGQKVSRSPLWLSDLLAFWPSLLLRPSDLLAFWPSPADDRIKMLVLHAPE